MPLTRLLALQLFTPSTNFLLQLEMLNHVAFKWLQPESDDDDDDYEETKPTPVEVSPIKPRSDSFSKALSSIQGKARERLQAAALQTRSPQLRLF